MTDGWIRLDLPGPSLLRFCGLGGGKGGQDHSIKSVAMNGPLVSVLSPSGTHISMTFSRCSSWNLRLEGDDVSFRRRSKISRGGYLTPRAASHLPQPAHHLLIAFYEW